MDYLASKEIKEMRNEEAMIKESLAAEKFSFQRQLENGLGEQMMEELKKPKKPNVIIGLKNKIRRARTIRKCNKEERRLLKEQKKRGDV